MTEDYEPQSIIGAIMAAAHEPPAPSHAPPDAAQAAVPFAPRRQSQAEQLADIARAERQRVGAILLSDAAKGRKELAEYIAFNTDLDAEAGIGLLAAAPAAVAPPAPSALSLAMARARKSATRAEPAATIDHADVYAARAVHAAGFSDDEEVKGAAPPSPRPN